MKQIRLRFSASFGVAFLVVTTGWIGASALSSAISVRARLTHSREIIDAAQALRENLLDAETSQRGYLLTGDRSYLASYLAATAAREPLATLQKLFTGETPPPALVDLDKQVGTKRAELAETVQRMDAGDREGALELVRGNLGMSTMTSIRADLAALEARELSLRDPDRERFGRTLQLARVVILLGMVLAFVLASVVNLSLVLALRGREAAQHTVEQQATQLQSQTVSLLQHERQLGEQLLRERDLSTALQRSNEELNQFAYATSHDLKAPLRGITNLATWIEEDLGEGVKPDVRRNFETLRNRARRLEALIEGALAYARAGRVQGKLEHIDTGALLADVVELIAPPPGCEIVLQPPFPSLMTARVPLQQVFLNLLQNGVKHGCPDDRGHVEASATQEDGVWHFHVQDHGPGIAPAYHSRIFGIFQTLLSRDEKEATGIGLAVVKKLVESQGGAIEVRSALGEGARFSFSWPAEAD